jgi:hypothetical protein
MGERRKNLPKDPEDTKGGVRGTHGLGDQQRDPKPHRVATQGGTASATGGTRKGGTARPLRDEEGATVREGEIDAELEAEERYARALSTVNVPGPGPNDRFAGSAAERHLDAHRLRRNGHGE